MPSRKKRPPRRERGAVIRWVKTDKSGREETLAKAPAKLCDEAVCPHCSAKSNLVEVVIEGQRYARKYLDNVVDEWVRDGLIQ